MENNALGSGNKVIAMAIVFSVVLLFLGVGVLVLIHVCIVWRTLRRGMSEGENVSMVERGSFGSKSMSQDDIEKLPCFDFKAKEKGGGSPQADCAVCLEKFSVGERCRLLPSCNHSFHAECVDTWLLRAPVCPICRAGADCLLSASFHGETAEAEEMADIGHGNENEIVITVIHDGESENPNSHASSFAEGQAGESLDSRELMLR